MAEKFLVLIPSLLLFVILSLSKITPVVPHLEDSQMICKDNTNGLICELQEMKLKIARLESVLEESIRSVNSKIHNLEEKEKLIEKMDNKIHFLQTALINIKKDSTYAVERVNALEEEVRLLWAASRKNNFDLHTLESKVQDTERNLELVTSKVKKIGSIVTEQWIQIRQLDQALQMRILKAQRTTGSTRCTFLKKDSTYAVERVNALEEEVRLLWAASRKINFDLHTLESKVQDTERNLELVTSKVKKIGSIVTEQWIQIRQLDQALQVTEMRILKAQRTTGSTRCTFWKFIKDFSGRHHPKLIGVLDTGFLGKESFLGSYMSHALYQLKRIMSAAQRYHHELQGFVKREMEKNEFTAPIANQEVVFFVASALVTFPILSAWMLLISNFS